MFLFDGIRSQHTVVQSGITLVEVRVAEGDGKTIIATSNVEETDGQTLGLVVAVAGVVGVDATIVVQVVGEGVDVGVEAIGYGLVDANL